MSFMTNWQLKLSQVSFKVLKVVLQAIT